MPIHKFLEDVRKEGEYDTVTDHSKSSFNIHELATPQTVGNFA